MALDRLTKVDGGGISTTSDYRVGVITASKFVGPIDGVVTGSLTGTATTAVNAQGLTGTPDIVVGILTASSANFSGNVSIGGTLTYEDVTNIDSVGIITARDGIKVGTGITIGPAGVGTFTSVHAIDSFACQKYPTTKISFPSNDDHLQIFTSNTQRMRFYAAGTIFIGEESQGPSGNAGLYLNRSSTSVFSDSSRLYDQPNYAMVHIKNYNATGGGEAGIVLHNDNGAAGVVAIYGKKRSNYISDCIFRFRDAGNTSVESFRVRTTDIQVGTGVTIETNGQATFVGVVTFGSGSTTIDNNVVNVGTALTLGHTQGLQFHTQNLHSAGFEVNQINSSGIITATTFKGALEATSASFSSNIDANGDLDVDGHTNLDNVNVVGVTTFNNRIEIDDNTIRDNISAGNNLGIMFSSAGGGAISPTAGNGTLVNGLKDFGENSYRWRNGYFTTLYGNGANLTGIEAFVTGMILLWSGSAGSIPSGFVLCNGSNSTPDLRGRFVVGYHDSNGDYDVGDTGGATTVTLAESQIPSHSHSTNNHNHSFSSSHTHGVSGSVSGSTNTTGNHSHTWQRQDTVINNGYRPWPASNNDCGVSNQNTSSNGNHSHTFSGSFNVTSGSGTASGTTGNANPSTNSAGGGGSHENRPPYYALCYIMKT